MSSSDFIGGANITDHQLRGYQSAYDTPCYDENYEEEEVEAQEEEVEPGEEEEEMRHILYRAIEQDDKDKFVSIMNSPWGLDDADAEPSVVWLDIRTSEAKECASALLNGETWVVVDLNCPLLPSGKSYLHHAAAAYWPWCVDELLRRGASADIRCNVMGTNYLLNPLNDALYTPCLSSETFVQDLAIFKIIIRLCLPRSRNRVETTRLLAARTSGIEEEILYYTMEQKPLQLATLLLAAREKVMSPSFFQKLSPSSFRDEIDCSLEGTTTLRRFIIAKLASLAAMQAKPFDNSESYNLCRACKEKEDVMMSKLLLLEVFERAGEDIDAYLGHQVPMIVGEEKENRWMREEQVAREVGSLLQKAGFTLKDEDIDFSYLRNWDLLPTISTPPRKETYGYWRMDSARHIRESTNLLLEALMAPRSCTTGLGSHEALDKALESLCNHQCLRNWTLKHSIFELLCTLCWLELSETLKTIKLIACNTTDIGKICCHCAKEGELIKLAALLMVTREKSMVMIMSQSNSDCGSSSSMVRPYIMHRIQNLIDEEIRSTGKSPTGDESAQKCKNEKAVMLCALQLVEMFERTGSLIDKYIQSKRYSGITREQVAEHVDWMLTVTGFTSEQRDSFSDYLKCFLNNMDEQGWYNTQRDIGTALPFQKCTFFLTKNNPIGVTINGHDGMYTLLSRYAPTSSCSANRLPNTFWASEASVSPYSALPMRARAGGTTKRLQSWMSYFSLNKKWASVAFAFNRRVKCP